MKLPSISVSQSFSKSRFFFDIDGKALQRGINRAQRRNLSLFGRDVRQAARRSIKRRRATKKQLERARMQVVTKRDARSKAKALETIRKKNRVSSKPGQPPYSRHPNDMIRDIRYAYEPQNDGVVAGYMRLKSGGVPSVLEFGGATTIDIYQPRRGGAKRVKKRVTIKARPAILPQRDQAIAKYKIRLKDSVK